MINEHELKIEDGKIILDKPVNTIKNPKGNKKYSIRDVVITPEGWNIIQEAKNLNPDGEFLFMYQGRPLTTDTMNRRLKKYSDSCGVPYLSNHTIRFTSASMLAQIGGMPLIDPAKMMGHSNTAMTRHNAEQPIQEMNHETVIKTFG